MSKAFYHLTTAVRVFQNGYTQDERDAMGATVQTSYSNIVKALHNVQGLNIPRGKEGFTIKAAILEAQSIINQYDADYKAAVDHAEYAGC